MRSKLSLRNGAILIALVAVSLMIGLYGLTNRSKTDRGNSGISLEPPLFISVAEASTGATAFPTDKASISAYVKLPTPIDIDKVRTIFTKVEDIGDNYIIGIVPIPNLGGDTDVHLYADTDGWLVACLTKEEPAAKIMKWPANYSKVPITEITTTTLQEALNNAGRAATVRIPREAKYYDFKFPDANAMTLVVKKGAEQRVAEIIQVKIPDIWMLYEASYYHYGGTGGYISDLKVDGSSISQVSGTAGCGSYKGAIIPGVLHTIEMKSATRGHPECFATVLIYKTD